MAAPDQTDEQRLRLLEEEARLDKARVVDSRFLIERTTSLSGQLLETELSHDEIHIEHIVKNHRIDENYSSDIRHEGEVTIIPVIEEQVEIIRHRVLKEEIHIHKVKKSEPYQQTVTVRSQEVNIRKEKGKP